MAEDKIELVAYRAEWPGQFIAERDALRSAVGQEAAVIEHIGSTAVPGARAKPTLDIMVGVSRLEIDSGIISALEKLGYKHFGEFGIPGRHFFRKGTPPTHHVHWVLQDGDFWQKQLLFRDYMRRHPVELTAYEDLKKKLAAQFANERQKYTAAKTEFIQAVLQRAKIWRDGPPDNYIICDLEATCWDKDKTPERMETIEFGAVKLRAKDMVIVDEFSEFVRPIVEPVLSDFCRELTSIRQADVDSAAPFPSVLKRFYDWIGLEPMRFCSWGAYDLRQLRVDCTRHKIPLPGEFERHINLRSLYAERRGIDPVTMIKALQLSGIELKGIHHRGIDDSRNIAELAKHLLKRD